MQQVVKAVSVVKYLLSSLPGTRQQLHSVRASCPNLYTHAVAVTHIGNTCKCIQNLILHYALSKQCNAPCTPHYEINDP